MGNLLVKTHSLDIVLHAADTVHILLNFILKHCSESRPQVLDQWVRKEGYSFYRVVVEEDGEVTGPHVIGVAESLKESSALRFHLLVVDQSVRIDHDQTGQFGVPLSNQLLR